MKLFRIVRGIKYSSCLHSFKVSIKGRSDSDEGDIVAAFN